MGNHGKQHVFVDGDLVAWCWLQTWYYPNFNCSGFSSSLQPSTESAPGYFQKVNGDLVRQSELQKARFAKLYICFERHIWIRKVGSEKMHKQMIGLNRQVQFIQAPCPMEFCKQFWALARRIPTNNKRIKALMQSAWVLSDGVWRYYPLVYCWSDGDADEIPLLKANWRFFTYGCSDQTCSCLCSKDSSRRRWSEQKLMHQNCKIAKGIAFCFLVASLAPALQLSTELWTLDYLGFDYPTLGPFKLHAYSLSFQNHHVHTVTCYSKINAVLLLGSTV